MKLRFLFALVVVLVFATVSNAQLFHRRAATGCSGGQCSQAAEVAPQATAGANTADNALAEVNAYRAAKGLPPFVEDPALTEGAKAAAAFRASILLPSHTYNDFAFLPPGTTCNTAGCGASSGGFQACCMEESWTHAGAASVRGRDGRMYHHLFVANKGAMTATCTSAGCASSSYTTTTMRTSVTVGTRSAGRGGIFHRCR